MNVYINCPICSMLSTLPCCCGGVGYLPIQEFATSKEEFEKDLIKFAKIGINIIPFSYDEPISHAIIKNGSLREWKGSIVNISTPTKEITVQLDSLTKIVTSINNVYLDYNWIEILNKVYE